MARIRTIKPQFWQDEDLATLDAETRLLAIGLLNHCDDEGYFRAHPSLIKAVVFPFSDHSVNIHDMLISLSKVNYLTLFDGSNGKKYGKVLNFAKHQRVNRPSPSEIKAYEQFSEDSVNDHGALTAGKERKGRERKGKEINTSSEKKSKHKFDAADMEFAEFMFTKILEVAPHSKKPDFESWANQIRLMRERDGIEPNLIFEVFQFANSDKFWQANILSPTKLREHFAKLEMKARGQTPYQNAFHDFLAEERP